MQLASHIKPKPRFFNLIPWFSRYTANSIYPYIFFPRDIFDDLKSDTPNPYHVALLVHEQTHYDRQKSSPIRHFLKYIFSSRFRFNEELIAVKEGMRFLKVRGLDPNIDRAAKSLSSWLYLWPVSKVRAKSELEKIWEDLR